jgi:mRNA interferase RelE/StbE
VFYKLRYHPYVKEKDLTKINEIMKKRIRIAIEKRLMVDPVKYGEPLRKTLKGYRRLRVGDYRIVYKIEQEDMIILGICHRKDIYKKAEMRI